MAYKVSINTDSYKDRRCSKVNWEPGTMNDFMHAINGWKVRENNLKEIEWRINYMWGKCYINGTPEEELAYDNWEKRHENKNKIKYMDKLCGFERIEIVGPYGFKQGYFSIGGAINTLRKEGSVKIPFKYFYDSRQYCKNMDGCYILIEKV